MLVPFIVLGMCVAFMWRDMDINSVPVVRHVMKSFKNELKCFVKFSKYLYVCRYCHYNFKRCQEVRCGGLFFDTGWYTEAMELTCDQALIADKMHRRSCLDYQEARDNDDLYD